jgi:hypothetical protein
MLGDGLFPVARAPTYVRLTLAQRGSSDGRAPYKGWIRLLRAVGTGFQRCPWRLPGN